MLWSAGLALLMAAPRDECTSLTLLKCWLLLQEAHACGLLPTSSCSEC